MFYLLLSVMLIAVFIVIRLKNDYFFSWADKLGAIIIQGFIGAFVSFIISTIVGVIIYSNYSHFTKIEEKQIIALSDSYGANGSFFLGSGRLENSMKYIYVTKNNEEMNMQTVDVDEVSLIYSNDKKAEKYQTQLSEKMEFWFGSELAREEKYKIYIPEGSIKQEFNVDLK